MYRRAWPELWATAGAARGVAYAFDPDPDGSYTFADRIVREAIEEMPWPRRAVELRLAGVSWVISSEQLPEPYRLDRILDPWWRSRLYRLDGAVPSARLAARIHRARSLRGTLALHQRADFAPATDTVLPGGEAFVETPPAPTSLVVALERPDRLSARSDAAVPTALGSSRVGLRSYVTRSPSAIMTTAPTPRRWRSAWPPSSSKAVRPPTGSAAG